MKPVFLVMWFKQVKQKTIGLVHLSNVQNLSKVLPGCYKCDFNFNLQNKKIQFNVSLEYGVTKEQNFHHTPVEYCYANDQIGFFLECANV